MEVDNIDAQEVKSRLTEDMVLNLMNYWGAELSDSNTNNNRIIFNTNLCHGGNSFKLYFFRDSLEFECYSSCGHMDIIGLVQEVEGLEFKDAIKFIEDYFQLNKKSFGKPTWMNNNYKSREYKPKEIDINERLPAYDESILNTFVDVPIEQWIIEGISKEILSQFEIKFDINTNSIIIPIKDIDNRLVGIRQRNLNEESIDRYGKYTIYTDILNGITYSCKTSQLLYGLNFNKQMIKESRKCIIVEGEKSVLKSKTWNGNKDITVCSYGCTLKEYQLEILKSLGVKDLVFLYDNESDKKILKKINNTYRKASLFFNVYIINDYEGLVEEQSNILDYGEETYRKLIKNLVKYEI